MSAWVVTIIDGVLTGLGLYGLVRLRMYLGPIASRRYGTWGRRGVWIGLIAAMVILAEIDLIWLRAWLEQNNATGTRWHYEAAFAALILCVGLGLVFARIIKTRAEQSPGTSDAGEHNSGSQGD